MDTHLSAGPGENVQKFQISEDDETKDCRGEECPAHDGQGEEGDGEDEGPGGEVALFLSQQRSKRHSRAWKVRRSKNIKILQRETHNDDLNICFNPSSLLEEPLRFMFVY